MRLNRLLTILLVAALAATLIVPAALADNPAGGDVFYVDEEDIETSDGDGGVGGIGVGGGDTSAVDPTQNGKYWLDVSLYHAGMNQTSMGNIAFQGIKALLITQNGEYRLQVGTQPVEASGYTTAITEVALPETTPATGFRIVLTGSFTTNTKFDGVAHVLNPTVRVFELTLPNTTTEYIPIRFKVPYTPMDAVGAATDGWLDARLRIYWSSVAAAATGAELDPPTAIAKGTSSLDSGAGGSAADAEGAPSYDASDRTTGVRITAAEGVIPEGAELKVGEIKENAADAASKTAYASAKTALEDTAAKFALFDITLALDGAEIQPDGTITLRIPIPAGFDKSKTALYRINDDSTATLIRGNVSGDVYIASLTRLSLYALAEGFEAIASPADKFTDIDGHWAYDYIKYVVERGLFTGMSETEFDPDGTMTRAMFVTVLGRIAGVDVSVYSGASFDDVPEEQYYAPYVKWASEKGIVSGVGGNRYDPDASVTREQMAAILYRYEQSRAGATATGSLSTDGATQFDDADKISEWARDAVAWASANGIINGMGDGTFAPKSTATRAQVAALLSRYTQEYTV
ncbi:MAG: S-layer homology domain-containing protein [Oscillospiraceae bacterium]|jgi:hypothetical protein|nr:S-layer homology domain-containing protein [Oscillospiraceae bacterium]